MYVSKQSVSDETQVPTTSSTVPKKRKKMGRTSKSLKKIKAEIRNLPGGKFKLTDEILKSNVCRICASYYECGPQLVPLYEPYKGHALHKVINFLLPIKVQKEDELSDVACSTCADQLLGWKHMRAHCVVSERLLTAHAEKMHHQSISVQNRQDSRAMHHYVDLMDSSSDEERAPRRRPASPRAPPAPRPPPPRAVGPVVMLHMVYGAA